MLNAVEALDRLREGNRRFASNQAAGRVLAIPTRGAELVAGQEPFAIILGCSDSRVPAELVFDQGFGDLFVIRVAGNIVAPSQVGSVEFAASRFGTRLVVVLGHSQCGAIIDEIQMLEQMGHARFAVAFMPRTDEISDVHGNRATPGIRKQQDFQTVWKRVFGYSRHRRTFLNAGRQSLCGGRKRE
jgi:carbonic anhydrase